jgi:hypothetical protein
MKKYFYTNGVDKIGPFSFEELKEQNLSRETKVWSYGLDNWTPLSEIEDLKSLTNSIPPKLKTKKQDDITTEPVKTTDNKIQKNPTKFSKKLKRIIIVSSIISLAVFIIFKTYNNQNNNKLYQEIAASAYETDEDFDFYVDKFYRDVAIYGLFPKKPKIKIIKFAKLDQVDNATHIHGLSVGMNDDDKIEIYINPTTWNKFNKPMRYLLMYHELSHDVLNVDDLEDLPSNEGKLMYPSIANYESKTMDDFIESSHELFEEITEKQNE